MTTAAQSSQTHRRLIRNYGKRALRGAWGFMGRQSLVGDEPILDNDRFPFVAVLEANWRNIRSELEEVLKDRSRLPSFHEISPDQYRISRGDHWKTFIFWGFGHRAESNCRRCPETARLLDQVPGLQSAFFSILAPHYHVQAHRGVTKGVLRVHLGLIVPEAREDCYMNIADQRFSWEEGKCVVFDDTCRHEVYNNTPQERAVLLFDFDRPMRLPGRLLHKTFIFALQRSPYFKDARLNMEKWEQRLRITD